jgi:hypothetical protein
MGLTPDQRKWALWLRERGGSGYLDRYGRLIAGGEQSPQGAQISWLFLLARGYLTGGDERISITDKVSEL